MSRSPSCCGANALISLKCTPSSLRLGVRRDLPLEQGEKGTVRRRFRHLGVRRLSTAAHYFFYHLVLAAVIVVFAGCVGWSAKGRASYLSGITVTTPDLASIPDGMYEGSYSLDLPPGGVAAYKSITVDVRMGGGKLSSIAITAPSALASGDFYDAIVAGPNGVIAKQSLGVDAVSDASLLVEGLSQGSRKGADALKIKVLVGPGDRVMGLWLPFAVVGIAANILWPAIVSMGFGTAGRVVGVVLIVTGVPLWLTSVALLVIPGAGLLVDSWLGFAFDAILYVSSRIFSPREKSMLASIFGSEYDAYRNKVVLPWL